MTRSPIDPIRLGLLWRRLDGIVDQVAETFVRAAFSVVVRDNYDMAFSLFDSRGRQLTQSKRSIPRFLGTLPRTLAAVRECFPAERLAPGDTIISNDAWIGTGHLNDISMVHPIFRAGRLVAYAASTAHTAILTKRAVDGWWDDALLVNMAGGLLAMGSRMCDAGAKFVVPRIYIRGN